MQASTELGSTSRAKRLLADLERWMLDVGSVLVCFSGGVDSALVLAVATRALASRAVALTAVSPSLPESERDLAREVAQALGAVHHVVESHELERPGYVANGADRCFHCKSELYDIAGEKQRLWGLASVVNGSNLDDLSDYRPGLVAAKEHAVRSPLVELGFTKADVRAVAKIIDLGVWDKPAAACLSSRLPYGTRVTKERLRSIELVEHRLKELGFREVRVRWHPSIARIEVGADELARFADPELREAVVRAGEANGFTYVTIDLAGYRRGSQNQVLPTEVLEKAQQAQSTLGAISRGRPLPIVR